MTFYERVKGLCDGRGISLNALVTELGFSASTATTWKNSDGLPRPKTVKCVAEYFGLTVDDLKKGVDEPIDYKSINTDDFNQPQWNYFLEQNDYDTKKAIKAYLDFKRTEQEDAMRDSAKHLHATFGNVSNNNGIVGSIGSTINAAPANEQETALLGRYRALDPIQKAKLLLYADELLNGK